MRMRRDRAPHTVWALPPSLVRNGARHSTPRSRRSLALDQPGASRCLCISDATPTALLPRYCTVWSCMCTRVAAVRYGARAGAPRRITSRAVAQRCRLVLARCRLVQQALRAPYSLPSALFCTGPQRGPDFLRVVRKAARYMPKWRVLAGSCSACRLSLLLPPSLKTQAARTSAFHNTANPATVPGAVFFAVDVRASESSGCANP